MEKTVIEYRPSLFYPPRACPYIAGDITFVPGVQAYPTEAWEALLSHSTLSKSINGCLEEGIFRVISQSKPGQKEEIPPLPSNQSQAIALVKKTYSISLLQGWQRIETRKAVLEAIGSQLKVEPPKTNVPPQETKEEGRGKEEEG